MSSIHPLAWGLLALLIPAFMAYLWQKRIEARRVPSVLLLRKIAVDREPPRRGLSRPRHLVSFALVAIALIGGVLAVVDLRREDEQPNDVILVLDTSASMAAKDDGKRTRLEIAVDDVRDVLSSLHTGDRAALVTTGAENAVRVGLTEDFGSILDATKTLVAGGTSDLSSSAIELADGLCGSIASTHAGHDGGRIILVSDGVGVSVPETNCAVEHLHVGSDQGTNVGISELSVREADGLGQQEVHITLTASDFGKRRVEVAILADSSPSGGPRSPTAQVVDLATVDVPASGSAERLLRLTLPPGSALSAEIRQREPDALSLDDTAVVPRKEGGAVKTLLVTASEKSFTAEALRLHPRVELTVIKDTDPVPTGTTPDLVVLEAAPSGAAPQAAHVLTFGLAPDVAGLRTGSTATKVEKPEITRWAFNDPLFRYVDFQGVRMPSALVVKPGEGQRTLVETEQGAMALIEKQDKREILYAGFKPAESDLVLRVGFVNWIANVVEWAASSSTVGEEGGVLSATESAITPIELEGKNVKERKATKVLAQPIWRLALYLALGLVLLEVILQSLVGARRDVYRRIRGWLDDRRRKKAAEVAEDAGEVA